MTIFDTRYAALIARLNAVSSPIIQEKSLTFVSLSATVDGTVWWESEFEELSSFRPAPPRVRLPRRKLIWQINFAWSSFDGLDLFRESFDLISIDAIGDDRRAYDQSSKLPWLPALRLKDLPEVRLFTADNRVTRQALHVLRLRANKVRRTAGTLWEPRKRYLKKPHLPPASGTVTENRMRNFVRTTDGSIVIDTYSVIPVLTSSRSSVRQGTPNFFNLKKSQRPVNPYSMEEIKVSSRQGYQKIQDVDYSSTTTLDTVAPTEWFVPYVAPDFVFRSAVESKAFASLLRNLDTVELRRENAEGPTNIVQFRQVVNMVRSGATKLLGAYRALKRGDVIRAQRVLFGTSRPRYRNGVSVNDLSGASKSVASKWLELQYGWKPILADIKTVIDTLHRDYHGDIRTVRGVGTMRSTSRTSFNAPFNIGLASVTPFPAGERVTVRTERCEIGIRFKVSDQDRAQLAQTGFLSPVSLAWELIPFSFVADWFYPIGPYLQGLTAFEGLTFVDGYKTRFIREQTGVLIDVRDALKGIYPQRVLISCRGGSQMQGVKMVREKIFTFPDRPTIAFKNPISVAHAANAVALLVANFRR